jgi:hypothetical protein
VAKLKTGPGKGGNHGKAGRPKGVRNRLTREVAIALSEDGQLTPLEYMLKVMRDEAADDDRRDRMASAAAPFMHARLQAIQHTGKDGGAIQVTFTQLDAGAL